MLLESAKRALEEDFRWAAEEEAKKAAEEDAKQAAEEDAKRAANTVPSEPKIDPPSGGCNENDPDLIPPYSGKKQDPLGCSWLY